MITVKQLSHRYADSASPSLRDITLAIPGGQLFGLLGPNGAGKTTLLSIVAGLLPCPPGTVSIDGQDLTSATRSQRARLSLVPQEYAFYEALSVAENLAFFAAVQGVAAGDVAGRMDEAIGVCGLQEQREKRAGKLSGGLKRRLNLAIGLLNQPDLLLLDEPTVGIDPHSRHFILQTVKQLNSRGATVVYTSHYMEEVEQICQSVAIIDHGQVLLAGDLERLLREAGGRGLESLFLDITQHRLRD
ncbi:MAG: ABC transporter ATP-binding protein [Parahaliea sp.]